MLVPTAVAFAACPARPLPPCGPAGFTGKLVAHSSRCIAVPPSCTGPRGRRGLRGARGFTGATGLRGVQGSVGAAGGIGASGPQGIQGEVGPQGIDGGFGPIGATGAIGLAGLTGPTGPAGTTGPTGSAGPVGPAGVGPTGVAGAVGPTGAAGAAATNGLAEYGYIYNLNAETVPIEADVPFDSNGVLTPGIIHAPGTTQIQFVAQGDYKVAFSASGSEPNQMAIFLNGALVPGTVYGSGAGTQINSGEVIVRVGAGDVITLRNHSSAAAVTLASNTGGTQANTNASIEIEKLG